MNQQSRSKGLKLFKILALAGFMIDIITVGAIFVVLGHDVGGTLECSTVNGLCAQKFTPLGVWNNMPSVTTELFGNSSYRAVVDLSANFGSTYQVELDVGCITKSNTLNAYLQLQYANYSATGLSSQGNTSKFVNIGTPITGAVVYIDNNLADNWQFASTCPGNMSSGFVTLPSGAGSGTNIIELRVVGVGGGGTGDNPRFAFVSASINTQFTQVPSAGLIGSPSTVSFTFTVAVPFALLSTTTFTVQWIATNATNTHSPYVEDGSSTCTIASGTTSCQGTVTYPAVFIGAPIVTITVQTAQGASNVHILTGNFMLFNAETLTV